MIKNDKNDKKCHKTVCASRVDPPSYVSPPHLLVVRMSGGARGIRIGEQLTSMSLPASRHMYRYISRKPSFVRHRLSALLPPPPAVPPTAWLELPATRGFPQQACTGRGRAEKVPTNQE